MYHHLEQIQLGNTYKYLKQAGEQVGRKYQ